MDGTSGSQHSPRVLFSAFPLSLLLHLRAAPRPKTVFLLSSLSSLSFCFICFFFIFENLSRRANHMARRTTRRYLLPLRRSRASVAETENPSKQNEAKSKTKLGSSVLQCPGAPLDQCILYKGDTKVRLFSLNSLSLSLSLCVVSQSEQSKLLAIKRRGVTSTFQRSHLGLARKRE